VSSYKGLLTLSYATRGDSWKFDLTGQLNGPMRLPNSSKLPSDLQQPSHSKPWINLLAQVTKKFKFVEVYVGGENLANFTQPDPIVDPAHPYYTYFDGSMVWGPLVGITAYAGVRLTIK